ncbi:MAG: DUF2877 domain-containing protein [Brevinema sp.]
MRYFKKNLIKIARSHILFQDIWKYPQIKVHSVFRHTMNFSVNGNHIDTKYFSIVVNRYTPVAGAVVSDQTLLFDPEQTLKYWDIQFPYISSEYMVFDFSESYDSFVQDRPSYLVTSQDLMKKIFRMTKFSLKKRTLIEDIFLQKVKDLYRSFPDIQSSVNQLVGLGLGFTPSGDDFLVGMFFVHHKLGQIKGFKNIDLPLHNTTEISGYMLQIAQEGFFDESLEILSKAIYQNNHVDMMSLLKDIFDIGSSSGGDILLGVLIGLLVLEY